MKEEERVFPPEIEIPIDGDVPVKKLIERVLLVLLCLGIITAIVAFLTF